MTGTPGATKAARIIAADMERAGLTPAGDSGFLQRVPLVAGIRVLNQREIAVPVLVRNFETRDSFPPSKRLPAVNVIGVIEGSDSSLRHQHILVSAHYDHIGIRPAVNGDSIANGADDDASGVVAVLEVARALAREKPRRTIVFATWIGEERGMLGARWYADHPARPLAEMTVNLEIEMIGRSDSLAGGPGRAWLTGYELSTLGPMLAAAGIPIVADKRPSQNFFQRSDNYQFALKGIVAQTLSSYNLHADYHQVSDDISKVDAGHMAQVIDATVRAVRLLANGEKPTWKPGGQPRPKP
jgi:Zn-dependent M28 family amino/carboxypeptidase